MVPSCSREMPLCQLPQSFICFKWHKLISRSLNKYPFLDFSQYLASFNCEKYRVWSLRGYVACSTFSSFFLASNVIVQVNVFLLGSKKKIIFIKTKGKYFKIGPSGWGRGCSLVVEYLSDIPNAPV